MRICVVGKYPPIEGGVSTTTFWLCRGLAKRGHHVCVVTNAGEVEAAYRMTFEQSDSDWFAGPFAGGGALKVFTTDTFSPAALSHIPLSNPFVTKIASLVTDVVRGEACDLILAYYYEPYAIGALLASQWTGAPLVVKHAGSDLDRLFRAPGMATAYREMLRRADAVVTRPALMERFIGMGVEASRLETDPAFSVPSDVFRPGASHDAETPPAIGIYGKIGEAKGTRDLLVALGRLAAEGLEFRLRAMVGQVQGERLSEMAREYGIEDRVDVLDLRPNWRVPEFIRSCVAVCFLERDFPVAIHGPIIPREVLACGICLVLSAEILGKQNYAALMRPGENFVLVEDPRDAAALAAALRPLISAPELARAIGGGGHAVSRELETFETYISDFETLLARRVERHAATEAHPAPVFELIAPKLLRMLRAHAPQIFNNADTPLKDPLDEAHRLCKAAADALASGPSDPSRSSIQALLKFETARLNASRARRDGDQPVFAVADQVQRRPLQPSDLLALYPVRGTAVSVESFEHDMALAAAPDEQSDDVLPDGNSLVLFHAAPHHVATELIIGPSTRQLLDLCDGSRNCTAVVDAVLAGAGIDRASSEAEAVRDAVVAALLRLYKADILVFGEWRPGWGWSGSQRSPLPSADQAMRLP